MEFLVQEPPPYLESILNPLFDAEPPVNEPELPLPEELSRVGIITLIVTKSEQYGVSGHLSLEIVRRESNFDPSVCNLTYGCYSGQGLFQIIPSTVIHCEEELGRELDVFDVEDNIDCGLWLLANEGIGHWNPYSGPY